MMPKSKAKTLGSGGSHWKDEEVLSLIIYMGRRTDFS